MRETLRGALLSVLFFALLIGGPGTSFAKQTNVPCAEIPAGSEGYCGASGYWIVPTDYCARWANLAKWTGRLAAAAGIATAFGMVAAAPVAAVAGSIALWSAISAESCG